MLAFLLPAPLPPCQLECWFSPSLPGISSSVGKETGILKDFFYPVIFIFLLCYGCARVHSYMWSCVHWEGGGIAGRQTESATLTFHPTCFNSIQLPPPSQHRLQLSRPHFQPWLGFFTLKQLSDTWQDCEMMQIISILLFLSFSFSWNLFLPGALKCWQSCEMM